MRRDRGNLVFDVGVTVPGGTVEKYVDETDAGFYHPSRHQESGAVAASGLFVQAVQGACLLGFLGQVERGGRFQLHPGCQLVVADTRFELGVVGVVAPMSLVEVFQERQIGFAGTRGEWLGWVEVQDRWAFGADLGAPVDRR